MWTSSRPKRCAPTAATSTRPARPAPTAHARVAENLARFREMAARSCTPTAPWCCAPRSTLGQPQHQPARPRPSTASSAPRITTPATGGASTRCNTYAHPIEDALERVTHSFCTLEFEDQRPFYDWLLEQLADAGLLARPLPQAVRIRSTEPHRRGDEQAQAEDAMVERGHRERLGRPAHAHAWWACAAAATRPRASAAWPTTPARARPMCG